MPDAPDLAAIEGRLEKATKGPWKVWGATIIYAPDAKANIAAVSELRKARTVCYDPVSIASNDFHEACANADFIAHAPEDIRALLDRVKWLEEGASLALPQAKIVRVKHGTE